MLHRIRNPRGLKVRRHTASLIGLNNYLAVLPGEKISDKLFLTEINENLLNGMTNSWSKQANVQGFDCEYITFKAAFNMFEHM